MGKLFTKFHKSTETWEDRPNTEMSCQKQSSCAGKLAAATAVAAAGGAVYYYHKDMTQEELKEAGEKYVETTKEYSLKAYESAKPYALLVAEKSAEAARSVYAQVTAYFYPEEEEEVDHAVFEDADEESVGEVEETQVDSDQEEAESRADSEADSEL